MSGVGRINLSVSTFTDSSFVLILLIITTIPLLFGAVHPMVSAVYGALLVVPACLLLADKNVPPSGSALWGWYLIPVMLILYLFIQSIPLPLSFLELVSPKRAERILQVTRLTDAEILFATVAEDGPSGLRKGLFLLGVTGYFWTLLLVLRNDSRRLFLLCHFVIGVGVVEAVYGLGQFVWPRVGVLWLEITSRAAHGTIIYKNQYASLQNMIWPLAVGCALVGYRKRKIGSPTSHEDAHTRGRRSRSVSRAIKRLVLLGCAVIIVLAVLFSLSRGGIIAMCLQMGLLIVLMPFSLRRKALFLIFFCGTIVSYGLMLGLPAIIDRFASLGQAQVTRLELYQAALPMFSHHWLTGAGVDSFTWLSPIYLKGFPLHLHYDRVHNEYLEMSIEVGLPVTLLFWGWALAGLAVLLKRLVRLVMAGNQMNRVIMGSAALCGVLGFLVHGLVDFGWRLPANILYCTTLLAIAVTCLGRIQESGPEQSVGIDGFRRDHRISRSAACAGNAAGRLR